MTDGADVQVEASVYASRGYNTKERFCSFWHQVDETLALRAGTTLEVGPGAGIVTELLLRAGVEVVTVDIDPDVGPSKVGSVTALPFEDAEFDTVVCCEVLEHLPWEDAQVALGEIRRVARRGAVVSLPDTTPWAGKAFPLVFGIYADRVRRRLPPGHVRPLLEALHGRARWRDALWVAVVPPTWSLGGRTLELEHPPVPHRAYHHEFDGEHYWEMGTSGYPIERIRAAFEAVGFRIEHEFRVPENPWHHFFRLGIVTS